MDTIVSTTSKKCVKTVYINISHEIQWNQVLAHHQLVLTMLFDPGGNKEFFNIVNRTFTIKILLYFIFISTRPYYCSSII